MEIIYNNLDIDEFFEFGGQLKFRKSDCVNYQHVTSKQEYNRYTHALGYTEDDICMAWIGKMKFKYDNHEEVFKYVGDLPKLETNDPYGVENVNFTLISSDDKRWGEYAEQRKERGFDDSELWSLDTTIAKFLLPRIKRYREVHCGYPASLTNERWNEILDKMVAAFEVYLYDNDLINSEDTIKKFHKQGILGKKKTLEECLKTHADFEEGIEYFHKYWTWLWD